MLVDTTPHVLVALLSLGMALAFLSADRHAPTSRALASALAWVGVSIAVNVLIILKYMMDNTPWWAGLLALPEALAYIAGYEWILRVRRTVPTRNLRTQGADNMVRIAQFLVLVYVGLSIAFPHQRIHDFLGALATDTASSLKWFYVFSIPLELSLLLAGASAILLLLFRRPDKSERIRLVAFLMGAPFMSSGLVLPITIAPIATAIGLMILLVGGVQYHVIQGQRAQFLSRFLSPQVAEMVREAGLKSAMEEQSLEISVVCCDLRGFTAFSKATESNRVIQILREYYDAVGEVAAAYAGTIKDQAGDGVLILAGAPIPFPDHAQRAVEMARQIRLRGIELTQKWSREGMSLGVGVGVASGWVTVGIIGSASRYEYTAVGTAVNLASRLCSEAEHGEVLVDQRTAELIGQDGAGYQLVAGLPLKLKGYRELVPNYILPQAVAA